MVSTIFRILSGIASIYTLICAIRIFLTWMPDLQFSKFGTFLATICDPYLNFFRRFKFLRFNALDFSPVLALAALSAVASIFSSIATMQRVSIGVILAIIINMAWSIVSSLGWLLVILLVIRLIFNLIKRDNTSHFWTVIDQTLNPIVYRISRIFTGRRYTQYKTSLLIALLLIILILFVGGQLFSLLSSLLLKIPF